MTQVLYAARAGIQPTSDLYTVDPVTVAVTSVGPIGFAVTGLAFDPISGILYGATSPSSGASPKSLITIDPVTGAGTLVAALGASQTIPDIAFDSAGQLYGWHINTHELTRIDKATGALTDVGPSTGLSGATSGNGIAFNLGDVCWLFPKGSTSNYYTMDTATGAATLVGSLDGSGGGTSIAAATFDTLDRLWAINSGGVSEVDRIDLATGAKTLVGSFSPNDGTWDALAWSLDAGPPPPPPTPVFTRGRYQETPPWRIIVGDLEDNTLTFLDRLALDRSVTVTRAAARVISGRVPSDNPEVNIPAPPPDSEPFLSEGVRLVSCFRREAPSGSNDPPWVIRARGIVLSLTDDADSDHATSTFTAYDPWKYWYRRPILNDVGAVTDFSYVAGTRADEIILDQFSKALAFGDTLFTDFGQTLGFYTGTIEATEPLADGGDGLAMKFKAGQTLGEMCDLLVATGTCDIVNDPIYDIANRPGLLTQTSIYRSAGDFRANAVMGWDRWPRSLVQLSRQVEGTERANEVQMYAGQGGPAVSLQTDAASLARFGEYWALQYLPGVPSLAGAHLIAQRQLALLKDGQYTYTFSPAAERAPLLFEEYREADTVPVYASDRFRDPISGIPVRIEAIPIVIGDDEQERVNQLLVSFAPESGS